MILQADASNLQKDLRSVNNNIQAQFARDVEMLTGAIVQYGDLESERVKADTLLKSILLIYFGSMFYRNSQDKQFCPWSELKQSPSGKFVPIAAILLHGSRMLIETPQEIQEQLIDWLILDRMSWRYIATHGVIALKEEEVLGSELSKCLKEEKVSMQGAAARLGIHFVSSVYTKLTSSFKSLLMSAPEGYKSQEEESDWAEHYGINLALGGAGNRHFFSENIITNNGEHGHLYINCYRAKNDEKHAGLLLGIEQSAPGKPDQYGGFHDVSAGIKEYSASGGDFYCKKPKDLQACLDPSQGGLTVLPIADYYDSLWGFVSENTFVLLKAAYCKCQSLLNSLKKEQAVQFIRRILSSKGEANEDTFQVLFDEYLLETENVKGYLLSQRKALAQLESDRWLIKAFMKSVIKSMGWFSKNSRKKIILLGLVKQIDEGMEELQADQMSWVLKNFIQASLMNRYGQESSETSSGKACVDLLNLPYYQRLKEILFMDKQGQQIDLEYKDLWCLTSFNPEMNNKTFYSSAYKESLYSFYKLKNRGNEIGLPSDVTKLTKEGFVYKPDIRK